MLHERVIFLTVRVADEPWVGPAERGRVEELRPDVLRIRLGTLDTPLEHAPKGHIFVGSKAEWDTIHDDLPQYPDARP